MNGYTIQSLRQDLADTIRELRDPESKMTVEKAKAIGDLGQTIINSAKVEVDVFRALGRDRARPTGFLVLEHEAPAAPDGGAVPPARTTPPRPLGSSPRGSL